mgnify:CR=1
MPAGGRLKWGTLKLEVYVTILLVLSLPDGNRNFMATNYSDKIMKSTGFSLNEKIVNFF